MQIVITGHSLPGRECSETASHEVRHNVHVGVQRRNKPNEVEQLVPADAEAAQWYLDAHLIRTPDSWDIRGEYIQGPPRGRFVYLSWVTVREDGAPTMFRRAKLMLDAIPVQILAEADRSGALHGILRLSDSAGKPVCAAVRPPSIAWTPRAIE